MATARQWRNRFGRVFGKLKRKVRHRESLSLHSTEASGGNGGSCGVAAELDEGVGLEERVQGLEHSLFPGFESQGPYELEESQPTVAGPTDLPLRDGGPVGVKAEEANDTAPALKPDDNDGTDSPTEGEDALSFVESPSRMISARVNSRTVCAIAHNRALYAHLVDLVRSNRHMEQLESRVHSLDQANEDTLSTIRSQERSGSTATCRLARTERLRREQRVLAGELSRWQEDAETQWMLMREPLREVLGLFDEILTGGKLVGEDEGLVDLEGARRPGSVLDEKLARNGGVGRDGARGGKEAARSRGAISTAHRSSDAQLPKLERQESRQYSTENAQHREDELEKRRIDESRLFEDCDGAVYDLREAQRRFDLRLDRMDEEENRFQARKAAGEDVGSVTEFDLQLLLDNQTLTRNLIEAEQDYEAAKEAAVAAGVDLQEAGQSSGFVDNASDGYRESYEAEMVEAVDPWRIFDWMDDVPEQRIGVTTAGQENGESRADSRPDTDEWDARTVEVWESASAVAEGSERKRIDKWQGMKNMQ